MAGLRSQEWRTRVFKREGETSLTSTVSFLKATPQHKCGEGWGRGGVSPGHKA